MLKRRILAAVLAAGMMLSMCSVNSMVSKAESNKDSLHAQASETQKDEVICVQEKEITDCTIEKLNEKRSTLYPLGLIRQSTNSWTTNVVCEYRLRFTYSDGSQDDWIYGGAWASSGLEVVVKDMAGNVVEDKGHSEILPIGKYQICISSGNYNAGVVEFEVKAPEECVTKTLTASSSVTLEKYDVVKVIADEKAVYQFGLTAQNPDYMIMTIYGADGNTVHSKINTDPDDINFYLSKGEYYICYNDNGPSEVSLKKKVISKIEMTKRPTVRQCIFKQDEIEKADALWNLHGKVHDNMEFKLTYTDGSSEVMDYEEFGKLKRYTVISLYAKDWDNVEIDWQSNDTGVYYEEVVFEEEGFEFFDNPLARIKLYISPSYSDVPETNWEHDVVSMISAEGIMTGLREGVFGPADPLARAQFATIIYRLEGSQPVEYTPVFPDVEDGQWFTKAVLWANTSGVVTGYTNTGCFGPSDNITREQMAVMMYRYAKLKGFDTTKKAELSKFEDAASVNDYAKEAMQWCVAEGIISGKDNGVRLDPLGNAARAECAAIVTRFIGKYLDPVPEI